MTTVKEILNSGGGGGFFKVEEVARRVEDEGQFVLTIKGFQCEELKKYNSEETELTDLLSFEETSKRLILSGARKKQLADLFPDSEEVEGKKIALDVPRGARGICIGLPE